MNNGDKPAMALDKATLDSLGEGYWYDELGLTKREHFAGLAMQSFITAGGSGLPSADDVASHAVEYANALLKALD